MISIIIPNYNSKDTISRCLNSVLKIKDINYEIIIVDDGSNDNSIDIIKKYEHYFDNVYVYYQESSGVSVARNLGIQKANGELICFLDSDDCINYFTFTKLIKKYVNNSYELIISNVNKNKKVIGQSKQDKTSYTTRSFLSHYYPLYRKDIIHLLHGKIYRKDIIKQNNIEFPRELTVGEDLIFNLRYFSKINQIIQVNISYYNYIIHENSVTKNYETDILNNKILIINNLIKIYTQYHLSLNKVDIVKLQAVYAALLNNFRKKAPKNKLDNIRRVRILAYKYQIVPTSYSNKNIVYVILMFLLKKSSDKFMYLFLICINKLKKL